jgi:hypothetical protein
MLYKSYKLLGKYEFQAIALGSCLKLAHTEWTWAELPFPGLKLELPLPIGSYMYLKSHWQACTNI